MLGTAQMGSWLAGGGMATRNWMSHEYEVMAADLAGKDSWGTGKNCSFLNLTFKPSVDSQIWHLLRSTGLTSRADRSDRSGLYSPSRIRVFVKSPYVILLVKGYIFPSL